VTKPRQGQGSLDFRLMSLEFRIRDRLRSPSKILEKAGVGVGMTVLDFGCGPGGFSLAAARLVGPGGQVTAVDIHPLALTSVRKSAERRGIKNLRAISGIGPAAVSDGGVDVVLMYDVLHDLGDADQILADIHRILKPGGRLTVRDHHLNESLLASIVCGKGFFRPAGRAAKTFLFEKADKDQGVK